MLKFEVFAVKISIVSNFKSKSVAILLLQIISFLKLLFLLQPKFLLQFYCKETLTKSHWALFLMFMLSQVQVYLKLSISFERLWTFLICKQLTTLKKKPLITQSISLIILNQQKFFFFSPIIIFFLGSFLTSFFFLFQETYPHTPPVWFAESEETNISNAIQLLSNTSGLDNHVINQVSEKWILLGHPWTRSMLWLVSFHRAICDVFLFFVYLFTLLFFLSFLIRGVFFFCLSVVTAAWEQLRLGYY